MQRFSTSVCFSAMTAIGLMADANTDQADAIAEIGVAIRYMDKMTQHNAAVVEQTKAAIE